MGSKYIVRQPIKDAAGEILDMRFYITVKIKPLLEMPVRPMSLPRQIPSIIF